MKSMANGGLKSGSCPKNQQQEPNFGATWHSLAGQPSNAAQKEAKVSAKGIPTTSDQVALSLNQNAGSENVCTLSSN